MVTYNSCALSNPTWEKLYLFIRPSVVVHQGKVGSQLLLKFRDLMRSSRVYSQFPWMQTCRRVAFTFCVFFKTQEEDTVKMSAASATFSRSAVTNNKRQTFTILITSCLEGYRGQCVMCAVSLSCIYLFLPA